MNHFKDKEISNELVRWFKKNKREMPWRLDKTPYRIWISELMLQQTKVDQVIPFYNKWMNNFPTLSSLSNASQEEILKSWEGLGYYSRARNIYKSSRIIDEKFNGIFPSNPSEIESLPGIGPYTKAAICSIAFNLDYAVLDGNVMRVLSRLYLYEKDISLSSSKKDLQTIADRILPEGNASNFNESIMEFGALICTTKKTDCTKCPIKNNCLAFKENVVSKYPVRTPKKKIPEMIVGAAVIIYKNKILISQRRSGQMLEGLWEFPGGKKEVKESIQQCIKREIKEELDIDIRIDKHLITINHFYSHFKMKMHTYFAKIHKGIPKSMESQNFEWVSLKDIRSRPFSKADLKVIDALKNQM